MTLWQTNQNALWWICKCEIDDPPRWYEWDSYEYYSFCESGLYIEWMEKLKEMNRC